MKRFKNLVSIFLRAKPPNSVHYHSTSTWRNPRADSRRSWAGWWHHPVILYLVYNQCIRLVQLFSDSPPLLRGALLTCMELHTPVCQYCNTELIDVNPITFTSNTFSRAVIFCPVVSSHTSSASTSLLITLQVHRVQTRVTYCNNKLASSLHLRHLTFLSSLRDIKGQRRR